MAEAVGREQLMNLWKSETTADIEPLITHAKDRLDTIVHLQDGPEGSLRNKVVVVIGGGGSPENNFDEESAFLPWVPRVAHLEGAKRVLNLDLAKPTEADRSNNVYTSISGDRANVMKVLPDSPDEFIASIKEQETQPDELVGQVDIIETERLMGNNVAPEIYSELVKQGVRDEYGMIGGHKRIQALRTNLRKAALVLLKEGGMLVIDDIYYQKSGNRLIPMLSDGTVLEYGYHEETIDKSTSPV